MIASASSGVGGSPLKWFHWHEEPKRRQTEEEMREIAESVARSWNKMRD